MELVPLTPPEAKTADSPEPPTLTSTLPADRTPSQPAKPARLEVDVFLAQAASDYRQGRVDQALWDETARQFDGDKQATVAAYLRLRARALKQKKTEEDGRRTQSTATADSGAKLLARPRVRYGIAGLAIGFMAVLAAWMTFSGTTSPAPSNVAAASPVKPAAAKVAPAKAAPISQAASTGRNEAGLELETKVRSLENAGNWNVLVLYAAEWTRKEPASPSAWTTLSSGYRRLGQLDDALDAANRAVTLAPGDLNAWRNLGYVEVALERLPEARNAFDKALAVHPEDADALCGAGRVASAQGRTKEATELMARVARTGTRCEDTPEAVRAAVYAGTPRKVAAPLR